MTEKEFQRELLSAFKEIGYSEEMRLESVPFVGEGAITHIAKAVFYSDHIRRDSETAVIAIQETDEARNPNYKKEVKPYYALGTPIIFFAEYKRLHQGLEPQISVAGLNEESQFKIENNNVIPFSKFKEYVKRNRENFSPRKLDEVKSDSSQSIKFKVEPYLFQRIFDISKKELVHLYHGGLREVFKNYPQDTKEIYNYSLILLAARILRDKLTVEESKTWTIDSVHNLIEGAREVNGYFNIPPKYEKILHPMMEFIPIHFNYSQLGIEALGHFYETAILSKETKQEFGVYYTPSIIAKTILKRMPIEEIRPENRILLDPTCGSGSFLVEGYKRLTQATYLKVPKDERHLKLIDTMYGNDIDGFAATISKLTLLLFHPSHKNNWTVFSEDAKNENFTNRIINKLGNKRPTIIVGNLPFNRGSRNQVDIASRILKNLCGLLEEGGLMGIILPESFIARTEREEREIRNYLLDHFHIYETFSIKGGSFSQAQMPAMAWILKKEPSTNKSFIGFGSIHGKKPISIQKVDYKTEASRDKLILSPLNNITSKISQNTRNLKDFYFLESGLQPVQGAIKTKSAKETKLNYLWTGGARNKSPFTNLREILEEYIILEDKNILPRAQRRELRNLLLGYQSMLLIPVNTKKKVYAILDIFELNEMRIAPYYAFYACFHHKNFDKNYSYALWAILNHPLASLYVSETKKTIWTNIDTYKEFPLPDSWNDIEQIKLLASKAKQLLALKRKYDSKYKSLPETDNEGSWSLTSINRKTHSKTRSKSDNTANKNKPPKSEEELKNKILSLVKEMDKMIYDMYGFTKSEIQEIEDFFGSEKRPGLDELGEDWKQSRSIQPREKKMPSIDPSELKDFGTSFETLEIDYDKLQVKLVIHGLRDREDGIDVDKDGIWLAITPYMPGWMLKVGANGWIYLKTYDSTLIEEYPEFFIKDFGLLKNAYKTEEEIEENLFGKEIKQDKKVG